MFNALSICFLGQTHEILKGNYPPRTEAAMETKPLVPRGIRLLNFSLVFQGRRNCVNPSCHCPLDALRLDTVVKAACALA